MGGRSSRGITTDVGTSGGEKAASSTLEVDRRAPDVDETIVAVVLATHGLLFAVPRASQSEYADGVAGDPDGEV